MGELIGFPEWAVLSGCIALGILAFALWRWGNTKRQVERTLAKRANPTHEEFLALIGQDVSPAVSEFLWERALDALSVHASQITPHPDDHLIDDLPINDDEWSLDWPFLWAENCGFPEKNLPDWPADWPATIRHFGRWLDLGPE
ncbi:MAG: hypothetical protein AAFR64_08630 [Pseudomonadota bacterium]